MNQKLFYIISGFFFGVIFRSFFDLGWALVGLVAVIGLAFLVQKNFLIALFCLGAVLGVARYEWKDMSGQVETPGNQWLPGVGSGYDGVVIDEPEEKDAYVRYRVELRGRTLNPDSQGPTSEFRLLVTARSEPRFEYGDRIKIEGKVKPVENFENADGEIFDWRSYLAKDEIYYETAFPKLELIEHGQGNWLREKLLILKHAFLAVLGRVIQEPEASLAGGLDLGAKQSLGKELLDKFRQAGLIHMVVLSGYNITIVALGVMWLFKKFLSQNVSIGLGVFAIILFAMMTGGGSTVLRASVMAILGLFAQATGRVNLITRALVIAAFIMIVINPKVLVFDTGFQLSFLATLGLIYLEPILGPYFSRFPEKILWMDFRPIASATIAAQLAVFPLILYTFGNFSIYAFPINMLVLPIVPTTMLLIFLAGLIGLFFIPLALPFAWIAYALLAYMIGLVTLVSRLPLASLTFSNVPLALVLILYAILIWFVVKFHKKEEHLAASPLSA